MPRTIGHFNRQARLEEIRRRRGIKGDQRRRDEAALQEEQTKITTMGIVNNLHEVTTHIYSEDEIKRFNMLKAIDNHPLHSKPLNMRSKLAYQEIMNEVKQSSRYLLPGMFAVFGYKYPKYRESLPYYDATPAVIFFGITRTKDNNIREVGFNLHYFPPFARARIIDIVYDVFNKYYKMHFNEVPKKPSKFISYEALLRMLNRYKIGFGLRMYIPVLRTQTYVLPTRLVPTMSYTEGHFSGATIAQIQKYWRRYAR